ncbi:uncharacterized protein LOC144490670 isoform X2 [Mustelus asterias]
MFKEIRTHEDGSVQMESVKTRKKDGIPGLRGSRRKANSSPEPRTSSRSSEDARSRGRISPGGVSSSSNESKTERGKPPMKVEASLDLNLGKVIRERIQAEDERTDRVNRKKMKLRPLSPSDLDSLDSNSLNEDTSSDPGTSTRTIAAPRPVWPVPAGWTATRTPPCPSAPWRPSGAAPLPPSPPSAWSRRPTPPTPGPPRGAWGPPRCLPRPPALPPLPGPQALRGPRQGGVLALARQPAAPTRPQASGPPASALLLLLLLLRRPPLPVPDASPAADGAGRASPGNGPGDGPSARPEPAAQPAAGARPLRPPPPPLPPRPPPTHCPPPPPPPGLPAHPQPGGSPVWGPHPPYARPSPPATGALLPRPRPPGRPPTPRGRARTDRPRA